jgi:hypothetical protein
MPRIPYPEVSTLNVVRIGALASQPLFEAQCQLGGYMSIAGLIAVIGIERDLDALGHLPSGLEQ